MKTSFLFPAALLLSVSLSPVVSFADDPKPADPAPAQEPKKEEPKKEEPKKEEPKKEEANPTEKSEEKPAKPDKKDIAAQEKFSRETPEMLKAWEPALEDVRRATVQLTREGKEIAYGCAVHENGYILTKASEVQDKKGVLLSGIEARFPEGLRLPVKLADVHHVYDLALLKVDARGLRPMPWDDSTKPVPGTFLAAATPMRLPAAVGVLSVLPRNLDDSQKGFLGVNLDSASDGGVKITGVSPGSPAAKCGMVSDDIIKSIDGKEVKSVEECIHTIGCCKPWQTVKIIVKREKGDKELEALLAPRSQNVGGLADDPRNLMAGTLSKNRRGYPDAFQHDMVLESNEVGGPIVDLDGHVVGMNIARAGRIECLAIPSTTVKKLLSKVGDGKLFHPELDALREERKNAEAALERLKKDLENVVRRLEEAEGPPVVPSGDKN
jgi:serine protease Do